MPSATSCPITRSSRRAGRLGIYDAMLYEIAAHRVRPRPGRAEPRAVRREKKHYPRIRTTRAEWKRLFAA